MKIKIVHFVVLSVLIPYILVLAENYDTLYDLFDANKIGELKKELDKYNTKNDNSSDIQFFNALFLENGEEAIAVYKKLFDNSKGVLKEHLAKKLYEYHYAKGYYVTASNFQKYLIEKSTEPVKSSENVQDELEKEKKFIIQVGAFGLRENAEQLQKMLETQNLESKVVIRTINRKLLYCVWLNGYEEFNKTLKYAENIEQKYQLQYRIIQP